MTLTEQWKHKTISTHSTYICIHSRYVTMMLHVYSFHVPWMSEKLYGCTTFLLTPLRTRGCSREFSLRNFLMTKPPPCCWKSWVVLRWRRQRKWKTLTKGLTISWTSSLQTLNLMTPSQSTTAHLHCQQHCAIHQASCKTNTFRKFPRRNWCVEGPTCDWIHFRWLTSEGLQRCRQEVLGCCE